MRVKVLADLCCECCAYPRTVLPAASARVSARSPVRPRAALARRGRAVRAGLTDVFSTDEEQDSDIDFFTTRGFRGQGTAGPRPCRR